MRKSTKTARRVVILRLKKILLGFAYLLFAVFTLFPIIWIFSLSLKNFRDIIAYPPKLLFTPTLQNYAAIFVKDGAANLGSSLNYTEFLVNSLIITGCSVGLSALIGIPASYALARFNFRRRDDLSFSILSLRFAPELLVIIPLYAVFQRLRLYDTYLGMVLVSQFITLPLFIWIMRSFFAEVPKEIEEAAAVDGCTTLQTMMKITLPITKPGIAGAMIVSFIFCWNNLLFGLVLSGANTQPVTVAILQTMQFDQVNWGVMAAAAMVTIIPGLLVASYFERYLVRGLTMGAMKQ